MVDEDGKAEVRKSLPIGFLAAGSVALAVVALALWWYAGAGEGPAAAAVRIDSGDAELVVLGGTVYAAHCVACHGAGREGEPDWRERKEDSTLPAPPHDETGHTWHHPVGMLFTITRSGGEAVAPAGYVSAIPGFAGTLTGREISASITFIEPHWPLEIRRRQEQITRRSHQVGADPRIVARIDRGAAHPPAGPSAENVSFRAVYRLRNLKVWRDNVRFCNKEHVRFPKVRGQLAPIILLFKGMVSCIGEVRCAR